MQEIKELGLGGSPTTNNLIIDSHYPFSQMQKIKIPKVLTEEQKAIRKLEAKRKYKAKKVLKRICFDETTSKWFSKHQRSHHNGKCFCKRCGKTTDTSNLIQ